MYISNVVYVCQLQIKVAAQDPVGKYKTQALAGTCEMSSFGNLLHTFVPNACMLSQDSAVSCSVLHSCKTLARASAWGH